jgi:hypothetical protein
MGLRVISDSGCKTSCRVFTTDISVSPAPKLSSGSPGGPGTYRVQSLGCGVEVQSLGCGVEVQSLGCRIWGIKFRVYGLRFRVMGFSRGACGMRYRV